MSIHTRYTMSTILACTLATGNAMALDVDSEHSSVSLVSTKVLADGSSSAAELFTFDALSGSVDEDGKATVMIDLGAVQTGIDIRNERMAEFLFETEQYPQATITAQIDEATTTPGNHQTELTLDVDMHGNQVSYTVPVLISADDTSVEVVSRQPILVDATTYELQGGIGKLAELAGLMHIPMTVPVTFSLSFAR